MSKFLVTFALVSVTSAIGHWGYGNNCHDGYSCGNSTRKSFGNPHNLHVSPEFMHIACILFWVVLSASITGSCCFFIGRRSVSHRGQIQQPLLNRDAAGYALVQRTYYVPVNNQSQP